MAQALAHFAPLHAAFQLYSSVAATGGPGFWFTARRVAELGDDHRALGDCVLGLGHGGNFHQGGALRGHVGIYVPVELLSARPALRIASPISMPPVTRWLIRLPESVASSRSSTSREVSRWNSLNAPLTATSKSTFGQEHPRKGLGPASVSMAG
jgi:hypothetical protein